MSRSLGSRLRNDWYFRAVRIDDVLGFWNIADELDVLVAGGSQDEVKIRFRHLDLTQKIIFLKYRFGYISFSKRLWFVQFHHGHFSWTLQRPKASWAQMLLSLGIRNTKRLKLRLVDADGVADALDAPIQRIHMKDLGMIAHILGFTSVSINIPERHFLALSSFGTISIIDIQTIGKVVHFQGDILDLYNLTSRNTAAWLYRASGYINGVTSFGKYRGNGICLSHDTLAQAITERWTADKFEDESRKYTLQNLNSFNAGPIQMEARTMMSALTKIVHSKSTKSLQIKGATIDVRDAENKLAEEFTVPTQIGYRKYNPEDFVPKTVAPLVIAKWQKTTRLVAPSIYIAATFMSFSGLVCGFPVRALLIDLMPWMRWRAKVLYCRRQEIFKVLESFSNALGAEDNMESVRLFSRPTSEYLMCQSGGTRAGLFGWGIMGMEEIYGKCSDGLKNEIHSGEDGWDAHAILTPETCDLLKHFSPHVWEKKVKDTQTESLTRFRPLNLLWIHVALLDVSIQFLIRGSWSFSSRVPTPNPGASTRHESGPILGQQMSREPVAMGDSMPGPTITPPSPLAAREASSLDPPMQGPSSPGGLAVNGRQAQAQPSSTPEAIIKIREPDIPLRYIRPTQGRTMSTSSRSGLPNSPPAAQHLLSRARSNTNEVMGDDQIPNDDAGNPGPPPEDDSSGEFAGEWGTIEAQVAFAIVQSRRMGFSTSTPVHLRAEDTFGDSDSDTETEAEQRGAGTAVPSNDTTPAPEQRSNGALNPQPRRSSTDTASPSVSEKPREWPLVEALKAHSGLTFGTNEQSVQDAKFRKLADLLDLRALFVVAFLILHPDSMDVYSIEGDIQMPMA